MLLEFAVVDSTNTIAWQLVDQGYGDGTVIVAKRQTAGRGQWGRKWESEPGGLYLSLIYVPKVRIIDPGIITIGTVWGIAHQLQAFVPGLRIKPPNDLYVGKCKLGGILTEARWHHQQISVAVIGVGINGWNSAPQGAISLQDLQTNISNLEQLRELTVAGINLGKTRWEQPDTKALQQDYQELVTSNNVVF
ncbi:MAG: biotin--[acetyl-CoA-carboxylase] ligase [Pseudanabaenaceae cyanobacterium SKYGB_i_bin29]|nr:biotin--[acetyl-CoA-carboxylase] ligase [Pseudanabaenaceae cyanobacterium SKYG29]MDW8422091.1 biotin--[acetyl-CoA-carboxylase] ligase [Pseudanabaenaceae cyanobacterium SKYGB_i_bin29]